MSDDIKDLAKTPIAEDVLNIVTSAGILAGGLHPFWLALFSFLNFFGYRISSAREARLCNAAKNFIEDLNTFKAEINEEYIKTDEFAYIFERAFKGIWDNYQEEKLECFRAILINSVIDHSLNTEEKEIFLQIVDDLQIVHIQILRIFKNIDQNTNSSSNICDINIMKILTQKLNNNHTEDIIVTAMCGLFNNNLTKISRNRSSNSHYTFQQIKEQGLTNFGEKFVDFITMPTLT